MLQFSEGAQEERRCEKLRVTKMLMADANAESPLGPSVGFFSFSFELKRIKFGAGSRNSYIFVFIGC